MSDPPGPPTRLREVHWTDLAALARAEAEVFGAEAWSEASWWGELAARPRRYYALIEQDGQLAGYAGVGLSGRTADVMTLAVLPGYRGRGYARVLLDRLEQVAARHQATEILLEVKADNEAARQLYAASGFVRVAVRRRYYQPGGTDALVLRKDLG